MTSSDHQIHLIHHDGGHGLNEIFLYQPLLSPVFINL
jgi:hypothetical protein